MMQEPAFIAALKEHKIKAEKAWGAIWRNSYGDTGWKRPAREAAA